MGLAASYLPRAPMRCFTSNTACLEHCLFPSPPTEPGAVPITTMRHPAAPVTAAGIPNPDEEGAPATWAA